MTETDRAGHKADEYAGKAKEFVGEKTDDESLANQGRAEQTKSKVKQAGDDLKDAARHATDVIHK